MTSQRIPSAKPEAAMEWQQWEFWAIALGVWLLLGLLRILSVVGSIRAQTCPLTEGMVASYTLFDYGLWLLLTPAMFTTATWVRFEPGRRLRGLIVHALVAILFGVVHLALFITLYASYNLRRAPRIGDLPLGFKLLGSDQLYMTLLVYAGTVTVALVLHHRRQQASSANRAAILESQLAKAELKALRMQLQPHFLFNTLHTIGALVDENPALARRMTARLGDFLRLTLDGSNSPEIPLRQELAFVRNYLQIEGIRFGDRLSVREDVEPDLLEALVPNFVLQPLVENSLRHGLAKKEAGGAITISAKRVGDILCLEVQDTGNGVAVSSSLGIGLDNVAKRLSQLYGQAGEISLQPGTDGGACARVTLPLHFGELS